MKAGKYREAIIQFRNALQKDPLAGDVREKLGEALLRTGDMANALGEYTRAADLRLDDVALQVNAGNLLLLAGRFDDAKARAEKALAKDAQNVEALTLSGNALAGLRDLDDAVAQVEEAIRIDPNRSGTYSSLGAIELSRGQKDAAEQAFTRAVELEPNSARTHLALGNFYWLIGQTQDAEQSLTRAIQIEPRNLLINRALANFYLATNRAGSAEQPLKTVFEVAKTPASAFALAEYYISVEKEPAGRSILEALLKDPRASATANARLATLDYKGGDHDDAYHRLNAVLLKDQGNLDALLVKSTMSLADGKSEEALTAASTATKRHPDSASAFFALGRVQATRKRPDAAIAAYEETLRLNPRAMEAKIALSQLHLAQGRPDAAIGLATEALASEPANGDAQLLLASGLLARGELDRAQAELRGLTTRFPNSANVHTQMGMLLGRKHDLAGAKAEFDRAQQLEPKAVEALQGLVEVDLAARDYKSARARVDARVASNPTALLLTLAARPYAASGDLAAAERFLRQAIALDSTFLEAYDALGRLYITQRKLDAARAEFEAVAERDPKPVGALTMVGIILETQGDVPGARARYERVLQIDPEAAIAANNLAWIYAVNGGDLDVALQLAKTAQKGLPEDAVIGDTLGFIYYKKNLALLAIPQFKLSTGKDPKNAIYEYHLGLAYASAGDASLAIQSLSRALALKPDFDGAQQAKDLLSSLRPR
jgi:putative PEP-CTERM system TPR-repeat lipoprotein